MVAVLAGVKDNHPCGKHHITAKSLLQRKVKFTLQEACTNSRYYYHANVTFKRVKQYR